MLYHAVLFQNLVKHLQWPAAVDHEVFRDDLEPIHDWLFVENMLVMGNAQSDTYAVVGISIEAVCRHKVLDAGEQWQARRSAPDSTTKLAGGKFRNGGPEVGNSRPSVIGCPAILLLLVFAGAFAGAACFLSAAAALAFAIVLAFVGAAAALAFARVLALTTVFCFLYFAGFLAGILAGVLCHGSGAGHKSR